MLKDFHLTDDTPPSHLPAIRVLATNLNDLDLNTELLNQYNVTLLAQDAALADPDVPKNQLASLLNTTTSILKAVTQMQTELHNAAHSRKLEAAILTALKGMPDEVKTRFFDAAELAGGTDAQ